MRRGGRTKHADHWTHHLDALRPDDPLLARSRPLPNIGQALFASQRSIPFQGREDSPPAPPPSSNGDSETGEKGWTHSGRGAKRGITEDTNDNFYSPNEGEDKEEDADDEDEEGDIRHLRSYTSHPDCLDDDSGISDFLRDDTGGENRKRKYHMDYDDVRSIHPIPQLADLGHLEWLHPAWRI